MKNRGIAQKFGKSMNNKHVFYSGSVIKKLFAFHVFASMAIINFIKEKILVKDRKYLIDGTFKIVPRQFAQLLTISIEYKNNVCYCYRILLRYFNRFHLKIEFIFHPQIFPVCYVLMTNKSSACYQAAFDYIDKNIFKLNPAEIITDFETGLRHAIRKR